MHNRYAEGKLIASEKRNVDLAMQSSKERNSHQGMPDVQHVLVELKRLKQQISKEREEQAKAQKTLKAQNQELDELKRKASFSHCCVTEMWTIDLGLS
jgi:thiamine kinase-like enzyme